MPTAAQRETPRIAVAAAVVAWILVVAWACVVWWLGGDQFGGASTSRYLVPLVRWFWPEARYVDIHQIAGGIRTLAHVVEYAILALLSLRAARLSGISLPLRMAAIALSIASTVAMLDEVRQARLASRVGSVGDVILDLSGAILAVTGLLWLQRRRARGGTPTPADG